MDALFVPLASLVGASVDQVKLILCLLSAYPLGSVFIRIRSKPAKHAFNIAITLFYLFPVLHLYWGFVQLLGDILATYFVARNVRGPMMPWIVFTLIMGHLLINHIIRAMNGMSYETVEISGAQMVLTMKLTTFAWNVWDGTRPTEDLDKWQLANRVSKFPNLLEFFGYAFYFPGFLVGPYLVFTDYMALIDESLFKDAQGKTKPGLPVPEGRKRVAYRKMVTGLAFLGLFVFFSGKYNFGVALEPWFVEQSLPYRIAFYQICGFFERSKYYALWIITEGASILTGLGFSGFSASGSSLWEGAANVDVLSIEFAPSIKVLLDSWNMKTNVWLRECLYKRVTPKGKKAGFRSSMLTFLTSAVWHGVSGGYYLAFVYAGFVTTASRLARSNIRTLLLSPEGQPPTLAKRLYDLGGIFLSMLIINYAATPFMLLDVRKSLAAWSNLGWYGHVIVGGALLFFYGGGTHFLRRFQPPKPKAKSSSSGTATPLENFTTPPSFDKLIPPQN
ncbi:hypothetical protein CCMSSC00406_0005301 [Pleurotus cornucopiae]|uniref:Uncharacterized protein n=1 Tax=Pleurotus cornucopiae TaxID=5321 RepID=A0ACB7IMH2_PLECO|nr:hypothetical protein CCMSSC00406_0005301 [Pleurotus cornucopiae]